MSIPYLIHFYIISTFLFSRWAVSFCDQTTFPGLCNTLTGPIFKSEMNKSMTHAREALSHFLAVAPSPTTFDAQANKDWRDCLELYEDGLHHLNFSTSHVHMTDLQKWLREALLNHQACQNGFKDSNLSLHLAQVVSVLQNFSKSLAALPVENKPWSNKLSTTNEIEIQSVNGVSKAQANMMVAQDGSSEFQTITTAIEASTTRRIGSDRFVIYVKSGVYNENIIINPNMTNLTLVGDGIDATVITNNKSYGQGYSTNNTATFQVWGAGFIGIGITLENTAGPDNQQAVALLSASDTSAFYKCSFKGYQDTLYLYKNRQFYRECDIYGTIDFIFGNAAAVLQNCNIYVRNPLPGQDNIITAQGRTDPNDPTGFVIQNSQVTAAPDLALTKGLVRTFLGRPWKNYSRVVYVKCYLHGLIDPQGWIAFPGMSVSDSVFYAEYKNEGNGAETNGRVSWPGYHVLTNDQEVEPFSVGRFLSGDSWIPQTGLPFFI